MSNLAKKIKITQIFLSSKKIIYISIILLVIFIIYYFFYISVGNEAKEYHLVILKKDQGKIKSALVLYYLYPSPFLYIYDIDVDKVSILKDGNYLPLTYSESFLLDEVKELLLLPDIDHIFYLPEDMNDEIFNVVGGVNFFNLYSKLMPKGEVFIDKINYQKFLAGIEEEYLRKDTAVSIWINVFMSLKNDIVRSEIYLEQLKEIFSLIKVNLNYPSFLKLIKPFLLRDDYEIVYSKMNFDSINYQEKQHFVPLNEAEYDRRKINLQLRTWFREENKYNLFPIKVQIKNATPVGRLAAKTTGVFRLKRLNVVEYLNSSFLLDNSVVLSHLISPLKENYVRKTSRINKIYYLVNYLDDFDFSILLGNDFYGVESVKQENEKNS